MSPQHSRGSLNTGGQKRKWLPHPSLLGGPKEAKVLRHPCILRGPQHQAQGKNQDWPTGGHIRYIHAFVVKLAIVSLLKRHVFFSFFAVNTCRKTLSHPVIFFAETLFAINACNKKIVAWCNFLCDNSVYKKNLSGPAIFCGKCVYKKCSGRVIYTLP